MVQTELAFSQTGESTYTLVLNIVIYGNIKIYYYVNKFTINYGSIRMLFKNSSSLENDLSELSYLIL